jgi:ERCC4-type nuclease
MLKIIIDTREQSPWSFPPECAVTVRGTLSAGDYAIYGDDSFAIERKSLDDFLGTISSGWERFQRELKRMESASFPARIIIVEGDFVSIMY